MKINLWAAICLVAIAVFGATKFFSINQNSASKPPKIATVRSQSVTEIGRWKYEPTKITGEIGWRKFPKFTLPANHQSIFWLPGRNEALAAGGDVFDWGFTHVSTLILNITNLPSSKKAFMMGSFPVQYKIDWDDFAIETNQKGAVTDKNNMWFDRGLNDDHNLNRACIDFKCLDCGTTNSGHGNSRNCCDTPLADILMVDIENIYQRGFVGDIDQVNLWNAMGYYLHKALTYPGKSVKIGYVVCNPVDNFGGFIDENYDNAPTNFPFGVKTKMTDFAKSRNMPAEIVGKEMKDWMDFGTKGMYLNVPETMPNGTYLNSKGNEYTLNHQKDNINWMTAILQYQEALRYKHPDFINADGTHRNIGNFMLFIEDGDHQKYYYDPENGETQHGSYMSADLPLPSEIAEGMVVFYKFSGGSGMNFWDYSPRTNLTPNVGIKPFPNRTLNWEYFRSHWEDNPEKFNNMRVYSSVEAAIHANWRLFATEARPFFEGNSIYLNENTEVDYLDGKGYRKLNAVQLAKEDKIFVRGIVQNNSILIAAQKPYADEKYQTKFKVRYGNWEETFSYSGKLPKIWAVKMR